MTKPITDLHIGEVYRFNGAFAKISTLLKHAGYMNIVFHNYGASHAYVHFMVYDIPAEYDFQEVFDKVNNAYGSLYEITPYADSREIHVYTKFPVP